MKTQTNWLAVAGGLMVAYSSQAQPVTGDTYLDNVTPSGTFPDSLYAGMASGTTFSSVATGLDITSSSEGAFTYYLSAGQMQTYTALPNPEVVLTYTLESPLPASSDYLGAFIQLEDSTGSYTTMLGGYGAPGNTVNSPNTVWTGNTAVDTEVLSGVSGNTPVAVNLEAGGDQILSLTFTFNNTAGTPYEIILNSIDIQSAPEPATLALTGLGGLGCVLWRRRK